MMPALTYKFLIVGVDPAKNDMHAGKPVYCVCNRKSRQLIGQIFWYTTWRMWVFRCDPDSVWSTDCLADVRDAMAKIDAWHKQGGSPT
jgi:hypothetical protein